MQTLRDHLRPDEDVGAAGLECVENVVMALLAGSGVGVHACDIGAGKTAFEDLLDALRTDARIANVGVAASGALLRNALPAAADVAAEAAVGLVEGVGDVAAGTVLDVAACGTGKRSRVAAPVEEDDHLLGAFEAFADGREKLFGENLGASGAGILLSHIDDVDKRHLRTFAGALREAAERVFALAGVVPRFERGRGGAKDDGAALDVGAHDGEIAGVVARRLLLLVARLVLLIDHDQAKALHRREYGRARPDDDARLALADALPLVETLAIGKGAVQDGYAFAEARSEAVDRLRRKADFRNENDRLLAVRNDLFYRADIDFRLSAAGRAAQKEGRRLFVAERAENRVERRLLFVVENVRLARLDVFFRFNEFRIEIAYAANAAKFKNAEIFERGNRRDRTFGDSRKFRRGRRFVQFAQLVENETLLRREEVVLALVFNGIDAREQLVGVGRKFIDGREPRPNRIAHADRNDSVERRADRGKIAFREPKPKLQ